MTKDLVETLQSTGFFEAEEESEKRYAISYRIHLLNFNLNSEIVLGKLNTIVREFVQSVARQKGLPEALIKETAGKLFTFGSYRLGVHSSGADIDTLCVAPQHVERSDFFSTFYQMLQNNSEVTNLTQIPDAYVPVMKFEFDGIAIDLVFARLALTTIPENLDLLDHNILKTLEEKCVVSLNGSRCTDEILRLVPNIETFHMALRCVKLWAKSTFIFINQSCILTHDV